MRESATFGIAGGTASHAIEPAVQAVLGFSADDESWFAALGTRVRTSLPERIGSFEIIAEAGRGGQGLVYRARQSRPERSVALKRLAAGVFATPSMRARFEREIEAVAALDHPNIVKIYGVEEVDRQLVVALQWIDGVPLDQWVRPAGGPPRPPRAVLPVFIRICEAVHHAHQRGVIHRDLKPSNVLIDAAGEPRVLDFGLARRSDSSADAALTLSGAFLGTPAFASPEQLRGENVAVDVRSDVYALGAMLYAAVTGEPPVDATLPPVELLRESDRVSARAAARLSGKADRELAAIILRTLQPDPAQRYPSVEALQADLLRYEQGERVLAHPPSVAYRLRTFARRNRLAVGVVSGFIVLTTASTIISTTLYFRAESQREIAEERSRQSARDYGAARGIRNFLENMLLSAGRGGGASGAELTLRDMLNRASERLTADRADADPRVDGPLHMAIADAYRDLGLDAASEPHYRAALKFRKIEYGEKSHQVAQCLDALARWARAMGRFEEAEQTSEQAWALYSETLNPRDPYFAPAANTIGLIKKYLGKHAEAERWYQEAIRRHIAAFGADHVDLPYLYTNLGALYFSMQRFPEAEAQFRDALTRAKAAHGDQAHMDTMMSMSSLADVLSRQGDPTLEAEALFEESLRGMTELYGSEHRRVGQLLQRYAMFLERSQRIDDACSALRQAAAGFESSARWSDLIGAKTQLAGVLREANRQNEALHDLLPAIRQTEPYLAAEDAQLAAAHLLAGRILSDRGDREPAIGHLQCAESAFSRAAPSQTVTRQLQETRELLAALQSEESAAP